MNLKSNNNHLLRVYKLYTQQRNFPLLRKNVSILSKLVVEHIVEI